MATKNAVFMRLLAFRKRLLPDKGERRVIEEDNQLYDREKEEKIKELKEEYQKALEKQ